MMLNYLADRERDPDLLSVSERIKGAYNKALADGKKTRDLGGDLGTDTFAQAVVDRLD
jgi:isocitrate/isopropylmalate dehydrogenase